MSKKAVKAVITFVVAVVIAVVAIAPAMFVLETGSAATPKADASETAATTAIVATDHNPISKKATYFITVAGVMGFAVTGALVVSGVRQVEDVISKE